MQPYNSAILYFRNELDYYMHCYYWSAVVRLALTNNNTWCACVCVVCVCGVYVCVFMIKLGSSTSGVL